MGGGGARPSLFSDLHTEQLAVKTDKEKIVEGHEQKCSRSNVTLPRLQSSPKQQIIHTESNGDSSTFFEKVQSAFSSAMESLFKWLQYISIKWPRQTKEDIFASKPINAANQTCPGDTVS